MGYTCHEFLIFRGDEKQLKKLRNKVVKIFAKNEDLNPSCIGQVSSGANYSDYFIISPIGWNGGWYSYSDERDEIMDAMYSINQQERLRYAKSKDENDHAWEISLKTFIDDDNGFALKIDDLVEDLRQGCNPRFRFIDHNDRYGEEVRAVDEETAKMFEKQGEEEWERKQKRLAEKMLILEEESKSKKKKSKKVKEQDDE